MTRPGLSSIASALAVELTVSVLHHPEGCCMRAQARTEARARTHVLHRARAAAQVPATEPSSEQYARARRTPRATRTSARTRGSRGIPSRTRAWRARARAQASAHTYVALEQVACVRLRCAPDPRVPWRLQVGHNCMGHNFMGHNYVGHHYIGHSYIGHNYIPHQIRRFLGDFRQPLCASPAITI